jgi:hypothetical protein
MQFPVVSSKQTRACSQTVRHTQWSVSYSLYDHTMNVIALINRYVMWAFLNAAHAGSPFSWLLLQEINAASHAYWKVLAFTLHSSRARLFLLGQCIDSTRQARHVAQVTLLFLYFAEVSNNDNHKWNNSEYVYNNVQGRMPGVFGW